MFSTPGHLQWPRGAVRTATTSDCFCPRCTTMDRSKQNQTSFRQKKHASAVCLRQTKTCAPDLANCRSVKLWLSSTAAFVYGKAHRITEKKKTTPLRNRHHTKDFLDDPDAAVAERSLSTSSTLHKSVEQVVQRNPFTVRVSDALDTAVSSI